MQVSVTYILLGLLGHLPRDPEILIAHVLDGLFHVPDAGERGVVGHIRFLGAEVDHDRNHPGQFPEGRFDRRNAGCTHHAADLDRHLPVHDTITGVFYGLLQIGERYFFRVILHVCGIGTKIHGDFRDILHL